MPVPFVPAEGSTVSMMVLMTALMTPPIVAAVASSSSSASSLLPDAPLPQLQRLNTPPSTPKQAQRVAPVYASTIPPGWRAQSLTTHGKVVLGLKDIYSFDSLGAIAFSAGYEHVRNGQPNYGSDSKAFGQRLGAAAARETSQNVFSEMLLAPVLREDSRYYVMEPAANPLKRALYAITRPLITRTDGGKSTVNGALLIGYAGAAALTPAYYPQVNRNFHDVAAVYGGSVGGAALGAFVNEFADDVLQAVHLKRAP